MDSTAARRLWRPATLPWAATETATVRGWGSLPASSAAWTGCTLPVRIRTGVATLHQVPQEIGIFFAWKLFCSRHLQAWAQHSPLNGWSSSHIRRQHNSTRASKVPHLSPMRGGRFTVILCCPELSYKCGGCHWLGMPGNLKLFKNGILNWLYSIQWTQVTISQVLLRNLKHHPHNDRGTKDFTVEMSRDLIQWETLVDSALADMRGAGVDHCAIPTAKYDVLAYGRYVRFTAKTYYGLSPGLNFMTWKFEL